jgi:hypothetical protein
MCSYFADSSWKLSGFVALPANCRPFRAAGKTILTDRPLFMLTSTGTGGRKSQIFCRDVWGLMNRALFNFLATFAVASAFARSPAAPEVTFVSPCECQGFHGKNRWIAKTDLSPVPSDKSAIRAVTPSQIYAWAGLEPDVDLTQYIEARMPSEQKWYALTGRVLDAKVEADGDIHIALADANGNNVGTVSAEIPVGVKSMNPS